MGMGDDSSSACFLCDSTCVTDEDMEMAADLDMEGGDLGEDNEVVDLKVGSRSPLKVLFWDIPILL